MENIIQQTKIPSSYLPDECCYKLHETLGCRLIFSMD